MSLISNKDLALEVPAGSFSDKAAVNKFGRSNNVDQEDTDIWDRANETNDQAIWVAPTAARVHNIVSTSAVDDGTDITTAGANAVQVYGLDASWDLQNENVIVAGTSSLPTTGSYIRIFRMVVTGASDGGTNTGTITATAVTDATVTAQIQPGAGQTLMAIYTVPNAKTAYMTQYYCSMEKGTPANASCNVTLLVREAADVATSLFVTKHTQGMLDAGNSHIGHPFNPYFKIPEKSDIKMSGFASANDLDITAGFDLILEDN